MPYNESATNTYGLVSLINGTREMVKLGDASGDALGHCSAAGASGRSSSEVAMQSEAEIGWSVWQG